MASPSTQPQDVFRLIERADEFVKYAQNRDPAKAYAQARETLRRAADEARGLEDPATAETMSAQIARRLEDLDRLESQR